MIEPTRSVKVMDLNKRVAYMMTKVCLIGIRMDIPEGEERMVYVPCEGDFLSGDIDQGDVTGLKSVTLVAPGGHVTIRNEEIENETDWPGSLDLVGWGVHVKAKVWMTGVKDSVLHCVSPRDDLKGFHDKHLERVQLAPGETITFREGIIGFAVVYGDREFQAFTADAGDELTVDRDTVLAVVYNKEVVNGL